MQPAIPLFRRAACALACTLALLGPLAASAAEGPLSLAGAQRAAVERSRSLAGQELAVGAAKDMAHAAGQLPDPVLSIGVDNLPVEGPDRFSFAREGMTMRRIGIMQELTREEKRRWRSRRFELEGEKMRAEREATRAAVQRDTALAWLDVYYAEAMARAIAEQRLRGLQEVEAAETLYRGGRGMQADVFMTRSSLAMLDDRAEEQERRVRTARTLLARWTGEDPRRPLGERPAIDALPVHAAADENALAAHPDIVSLAKQGEIATAEANLARAMKKPDWTVQLMYGVRGSAFGDMVSVGVSVPLPWDQANRQDREVSAKLAQAGQAEAQRDEALRAHLAEVRTMVQEWESNRERLVRYEREIVPLSTARADASLAAYRGGKSSVAEVLAARRMELESRLQALQLEAETARLWARLNYLVAEDSK